MPPPVAAASPDSQPERVPRSFQLAEGCFLGAGLIIMIVERFDARIQTGADVPFVRKPNWSTTRFVTKDCQKHNGSRQPQLQLFNLLGK